MKLRNFFFLYEACYAKMHIEDPSEEIGNKMKMRLSVRYSLDGEELSKEILMASLW